MVLTALAEERVHERAHESFIAAAVSLRLKYWDANTASVSLNCLSRVRQSTFLGGGDLAAILGGRQADETFRGIKPCIKHAGEQQNAAD